jgi:hypothetical protein
VIKAPQREQLEIIELCDGCYAYPNSVFKSEAEASEAWRKYRRMLLERAAPGERPRAFYVLELHAPAPRRRFDELSFLLDRALIGDEEAKLIDFDGGLYGSAQGAKFCSAFETTAGVCAQGLGTAGLRYLKGEFETAGRWHEFRDRAELSAKYKRLAAIVDAVIEGREEL